MWTVAHSRRHVWYHCRVRPRRFGLNRWLAFVPLLASFTAPSADFHISPFRCMDLQSTRRGITHCSPASCILARDSRAGSLGWLRDMRLGLLEILCVSLGFVVDAEADVGSRTVRASICLRIEGIRLYGSHPHLCGGAWVVWVRDVPSLRCSIASAKLNCCHFAG